MVADIIPPDIRHSIFAHVVHVLLLGGVVVYGWLAVSAFVRKPTRVLDGIRKAVRGAWLAVLFLLLTAANPVTYLQPAALVLVAMVVTSVVVRRDDKLLEPVGDRSRIPG